MSFGIFPGGVQVTSLMRFKVLRSLLMSGVIYLSPWARQNFLAPLKIEQTLSHRLEIANAHVQAAQTWAEISHTRR